VDRRNVTTLDHRTELDIAEERDLSLDVFGKGALGSAYEDVGLYSELHELAHGMLGRFRFHLARRSYERNQGEMDEYSILASDLLAELAHRFEERLRFDVTDRSANLDYHNVVVWCKAFHRGLDLVRDVRNHLDRGAEVFTSPLLGDDIEVDATGRDVV